MVAVRRAAVIATAILLGLTGCTSIGTKPAANSQGPTGQTDPDAAKIVQAAQAAAKANQEANPSSIEWVRTTYASVEKVMDFGGQPGQESKPSILVVIRGTFVAQTKGPPATGDTIELALDPSTWQSTDFSIGNFNPDLSPYGTVHHG